jgi:hypothetical protein
MAFTLETTLVLPLSLSLLMGLTGMTLPILDEFDSTAREEIRSQVEQLSLAHLDQPGEQSYALQTSPQHMVEWIELAYETKGLLTGKSGTVQ